VSKDRGIYPKYVVFKHPKMPSEEMFASAIIDWGDEGTGNSDIVDLEPVNDFVFVLKPISDPHARIALAAYAQSVKESKPQLAADIMEILSDF
jgi:hypothetical protein